MSNEGMFQVDISGSATASGGSSDASTAASPTDPKRRLPQRWLVPRFSLRTVLFLITAVCLVLGLAVIRAERQRIACEALTRNEWEWHFEKGNLDKTIIGRDPILTENEPWLLTFLPLEWRRSHGVHYWRSVERVHDGEANAPEMFAAIAQLPTIRKLVITHGQYPGDRDIWPIVGRLRTLRELVLRETTIDDEGMAHLGKLTRLQSLDLGGTIVGDQGAKHLASLSALDDVRLDDTNITDESIKVLAALPHLKRVHVSDTRVTPEAAKALLRLPHLIELNKGTKAKNFAISRKDRVLFLDQRALRKLEVWKSERPLHEVFSTLVLDSETLTPEELEYLPNVQGVWQLVVRGRKIGDQQLISFEKWEGPVQAFFGRTSLGHEGFRWLAKRSTLRELIIEGSPVAAEDFAALANLENFETLTIRDTPIDQETLTAILSLPKLFDLELTNCELPQDAAEQFERYKKPVVRIALNHTGVPPDDFLKHRPPLVYGMTWDGVQVSDGVLDWLKGKTTAPHTSLMAKVGEGPRRLWCEPQKYILGAHDDEDRFYVLSLRSRFVGESHLLQALAAWPDCRYVDLRGSHTGSVAMDVIGANRYVKLLELAKTNISDEDLRHASQWTNLRDLNLAGCSITDSGIAYLEPCWRLERLNADGTHLSDASIATIAEMKRLRSLSLRETKITDAGLLGLEGLENLETLRLSGSQVTAEGVAEFENRHPDCEVELLEREVYDAPYFRG